jgi:hypothetical protein
MKIVYLVIGFLLLAVPARAADSPFALTIDVPSQRSYGGEMQRQATFNDEPLHVFLKNTSSETQYLQQCTCDPRLMNMLSFEIKKGNGVTKTVECGFHYQQKCDEKGCTAGPECDRNFCFGYALPPGKSYIFDVTSKTCNWNEQNASEVQMRALFDLRHVAYHLSANKPVPTKTPKTISSDWTKLELWGGDSRNESCIDCYDGK